MIKLTNQGFECTSCKQVWFSRFKAKQHEINSLEPGCYSAARRDKTDLVRFLNGDYKI